MAKEVLIYGPIYSYMAENFINSINEISDDEELVVRINTTGGEVSAGWSMIAKFAEFKGKKSVKVDGEAKSMGAFFALYADNVEALDVSTFLFHRAAYPSWYEKDYMTAEQKADLIESNKLLEKAFKAKIDVEKFEKISGKKLKDIFSMDSRIDVILSASQAKSVGLISKVNPITPSRKSEITAMVASLTKDYLDKNQGVAAVFFGESETTTVESNEQITNQKIKVMTKDQFKVDYPEAYAAIVKEGVVAERDRCGAWLAFNDVDPKAVADGIKNGEVMSQTQMADFSQKMFAKAAGVKIEAENAQNVETAVVETVIETPEAKAAAEFQARIDAALGRKTESKS